MASTATSWCAWRTSWATSGVSVFRAACALPACCASLRARPSPSTPRRCIAHARGAISSASRYCRCLLADLAPLGAAYDAPALVASSGQGAGGAVWLHDWPTRELRGVLIGHEDNVTCLSTAAELPDWLLSSFYDGAPRIEPACGLQCRLLRRLRRVSLALCCLCRHRAAVGRERGGGQRGGDPGLRRPQASPCCMRGAIRLAPP